MTELPRFIYHPDILHIDEEVVRMEATLERLRILGKGGTAAFGKLSRLYRHQGAHRANSHIVIEELGGFVICSCALMVLKSLYEDFSAEEWKAHPGHIKYIPKTDSQEKND